MSGSLFSIEGNSEPDGTYYVRDTQYYDHPEHPTTDNGKPVNDWVQTPVLGMECHENGCWQSDPAKDEVNESLWAASSRHALYPKDDQAFVIYTDADMCQIIASLISNLMLLYSTDIASTDSFCVRFDTLTNALCRKLSDTYSPWRGTTPEDLENRTYIRSLLFWCLTHISELNNTMLEILSEKLGIWASTPSTDSFNRGCKELFGIFNIPLLSLDDERLMRLYQKPPTI